MKKIFVLFVLFTVAIVLHGKEPKYIFLFIGDGMAMPQRMISEEFSRKIGRGDLQMNHFPFHATTRTSSANALITDSAAAATAIACGEKTNHHMVGVFGVADGFEGILGIGIRTDLVGVRLRQHRAGSRPGRLHTVHEPHAGGAAGRASGHLRALPGDGGAGGRAGLPQRRSPPAV